ncbi:MAG: glucosyltransferase domain-containing protein [Clostridium sp.]|jgi:hypothetical protein|nr:glucosyltransferase domain-containing protein [Clostridium sp.]
MTQVEDAKKRRWRSAWTQDPRWKSVFLTVLCVGFFVHLPILLRDIPNHDGLASAYFDQNMITSGRWFLGMACALSSYYSLPWMTGVLGFFWLALTGVVLVEFLEVRSKISAGLIGALLVTFPVIASNFAYVFTMDGYMLGVFLCVCAPLAVKKLRYGFLFGAVALAFGLGIYQSYLPFAVILALMECARTLFTAKKIRDWAKIARSYLMMGGVGVLLYLGILHLLLWIQGKELASYQGIDEAARFGFRGLGKTFTNMFLDFIEFSVTGKILLPNLFVAITFILAILLAGYVFVKRSSRRKKAKPQITLVWRVIILCVLLVLIPFATNVVLLISPTVSYHTLMRFQWVLFPILLLGVLDRYAWGKSRRFVSALTVILGIVWISQYTLTDQIAYSNLQKRYEKTYAYCLRLLDRIEQTPGYYTGIPIAMIGVVGDAPYPTTDYTQAVTATMIGIGGDSLLYTGKNYQQFMEQYLGATLNFLPPEAMEEAYYMDFYMEMESFPAASSICVRDGILYIKTENMDR